MYSNPSVPAKSRRYALVRSSLRSNRSNRTRSTPSAAAWRSMAATKRRVIGPISADDGTGLPRILRKKYAAPAPLCSIGT